MFKMTLQAIRDQRPCEEGWRKLLTNLGNPPMETEVTLGDVAASNGPADAWWCVRALDWSDVNVRRAVISALMPTVRRASAHIADQRVHDCIAAIDRWIAGKDVDLYAAAMAARAAAAEAWAAAETAAWAARADKAAWAADKAAWAAAAAASSAWAAARAASSAWAAELKAQRQDLIAVFPPLLMGKTK